MKHADTKKPAKPDADMPKGMKEGSKAEEAFDATELSKAKGKTKGAPDPDGDDDAGQPETAAAERAEPMLPGERMMKRDMQRMSARKSGAKLI